MKQIKLWLSKYKKEFMKIDRTRRIIILLILLLSFGLGLSISIGYYKLSFFGSNTLPKVKTAPTPVPIPVTLQLTSPKSEATVNSALTGSLIINSPNTGIDAAEFYLNFNPDFVSVASVSAGTFFKVYSEPEIKESSVNFSTVADFANDKFIVPLGTGKVADIIFKVLDKPGNTTISIDKEKTVVASGGNNILGKTSDLEIRITN